jgi:hypothetical protein
MLTTASASQTADAIPTTTLFLCQSAHLRMRHYVRPGYKGRTSFSHTRRIIKTDADNTGRDMNVWIAMSSLGRDNAWKSYINNRDQSLRTVQSLIPIETV